MCTTTFLIFNFIPHHPYYKHLARRGGSHHGEWSTHSHLALNICLQPRVLEAFMNARRSVSCPRLIGYDLPPEYTIQTQRPAQGIYRSLRASASTAISWHPPPITSYCKYDPVPHNRVYTMRPQTHTLSHGRHMALPLSRAYHIIAHCTPTNYFNWRLYWWVAAILRSHYYPHDIVMLRTECFRPEEIFRAW